MTEIRELEVTIKHNLLTGKSALLFASFLQREAFLVFFLLHLGNNEILAPLQSILELWYTFYVCDSLSSSFKTLEFRRELPNSGSPIIFFNLYF